MIKCFNNITDERFRFSIESFDSGIYYYELCNTKKKRKSIGKFLVFKNI